MMGVEKSKIGGGSKKTFLAEKKKSRDVNAF